MSFGLQTFDASGNLVFDSNSRAFSMYDVFTIPRRTRSSKAYPELAGCTIDIHAAINTDLVGQFGNAPRLFSISYAAGYPVVSWDYNEAYANASLNYAEMVVFVVIKTSPTANTFGFLVNNDEFELASTDFTKNYAYIGDATLVTHVDTNVYTDGFAEYSISSSVIPIPFVENVEGQLTSVTRVRLVSGSWRIRVVKSSNVVPRVLCFAPVTSVGAGHGVQVFSSSGDVDFDSTKRVLSAASYANYVVASTAYSNNGTVFFRLLQTTLLSSSGSIPASAASFCPMQCFHGGEVNSGGNIYLKYYSGGVKKQSGAMYSGWVTDLWSSSPFNTFFPITTVSGLSRIYTIDMTRYPAGSV